MLFRFSEDYRAALLEERGETLDRYARAHFGLEEQCMYRHRCPVAERNAAAHKRFIEALAGYRARYREDGFDRQDAMRLVEYIDDWLVNHIGRIDTKLKSIAERI